MGNVLREGFTTGSAATGAALAALHFLVSGNAPESARVPLPPMISQGCGQTSPARQQPRAWLELPVAACAPGPAPELLSAWSQHDAMVDPMPEAMSPECMGRAAHAVVIKDGGDDPDVTTGAHITATVVMGSSTASCTDVSPAEDRARAIAICGGPGVGRVTLPGLPLPVGTAAINPVPREQLRFALNAALRALLGADAALPQLWVFLSVPEGRDLAPKTFNPRLGIVGGISILGTQGTVRPYSHAAWQATIRQGLDVARATGCQAVCCSTGRRSERLLMARYPELPAQSFVQVADFVAYSLKIAGEMDFRHIIWGCFFGKLVKLAQGHPYTHAGSAALDMQALAQLARKEHAACAERIGQCITAAHALDILLADPAGPRVLACVVHRAADALRGFAGRAVRVHFYHFDGREVLML